MLELVDVHVTYEKNIPALKGVNLKINEGEFVAVIGSSGSGKSTLIKTINGLVGTSAGKVIFYDTPVQNSKGKKLREIRRRIGFIFQNYNLVDRLTVLENVLLGRLGYKSFFSSVFGKFSPAEYAIAFSALEQVALTDKIFSRADELSGGQKQRVAIAKALVQSPDLILADEPVSSLDLVSTNRVMDYFKRVNQKKNITIIMNLHDVTLAKKYADRIVALKDGMLVFNNAVGVFNESNPYSIY